MVDLNVRTISMTACLVSLTFPIGAALIVSSYRVFLGTLYPAYASYKAIRNKDVKEYVSYIHSHHKSSNNHSSSFFLQALDLVIHYRQALNIHYSLV